MNKATASHIIIKLLKTRVKEKNLKSRQRKIMSAHYVYVSFSPPSKTNDKLYLEDLLIKFITTNENNHIFSIVTKIYIIKKTASVFIKCFVN